MNWFLISLIGCRHVIFNKKIIRKKRKLEKLNVYKNRKHNIVDKMIKIKLVYKQNVMSIINKKK